MRRPAAPRLACVPAYLLALALAAGPAAAQPFVQAVAPFPVLDAGGQAYAYPFLGGFNAPRPQLVDVDADDDRDLFVQEQSGRVMFFENTGTPRSYRFTWRTDDYQGLAVGEWFRLGDLDGDGDPDLLAEERFSHVRYYRNDGTPHLPRFVLAADTLRTAGGTPVFADAQNVPALADLTCTGLPDLFSGQVDGTLTRYVHAGVEGGLPRFADPVHDVENLCVGPPDVCLPGAGARGHAAKQGAGQAPQHGANAIAFGDVDGDGDTDLVWGDFFSPSLYFIENTGTCAAPRLVLRADAFPPADPLHTGGYNAPYLADLDADGDADLLVGVLGGAFGVQDGGSLVLFEREPAAFVRRTTAFLPTLDLGEESVPTAADLDADGDLDLLVGDKAGAAFRTGRLTVLENTGTAAAPVFRHAGEIGMDSVRFNAAPAAADLDADGDLDLLVGGFERGVAWLRNDGTATASRFVMVDSAYVEIPRGSHTAPAVADLDADGDLDLLVGEASGDLNFFRNDGTPAVPRFVLASEAFGGLAPGRRSVPAFSDADADDDLDLFVGTQADGIVFFRNTGTAQAPAFTPDAALALAPAPFAAPAPADLDGDGDADLLVGGRGGGLRYFANERIPTLRETPPVVAPAQLLPAYPNPFRTATRLRAVLPRPGRVHLAVYDLLGREVARLVDGWQPAGPFEATLDGSTLAPGVYVYRLRTADGRLLTGRVVRLR